MRARWLASSTRSNRFSTLSMQSSTVTRAMGAALLQRDVVLKFARVGIRLRRKAQAGETHLALPVALLGNGGNKRKARRHILINLAATATICTVPVDRLQCAVHGSIRHTHGSSRSLNPLRDEEIMSGQAEKIALFIDGANLYATAKSLGFDIDYKRLLREFQSRGNLLRAFYYTAVIEDQEYSSIRPLIDWLDYNGYTVVTKATKEFVDQTGRRKVKGNMDIELAVDAMELAPHIDHMVLVLRRRRFPLAGGSGAAARRAGHGDLDHLDPAADGGRRAAPAGRHLPRHRRAAAQDRARSGRARRPRAAGAARTRRNSCSAATPRSGPAPVQARRRRPATTIRGLTGHRRPQAIHGRPFVQSRPRLPALPAPRRVPARLARARAGLVQRPGALVRPASTRAC